MINIKRFLLGLLLLCPLIGHTAPASTVSRSVMEMSNIIVAPQFFWQTQIFSVPFSNVVNAVVTNHGGGSSTGGVAVIQGTNIVLTTNSGAVTINSTVGTNSLFWKTNFNNGITNTGGNVIVNSGTFQVGNGASGHVFFTNGSAALGNGNLVISPSAFTVKTNGSADVDAFLDDGEVFLGGGLLTYKVWLDFFGGLTVTNLSGSGNRFVQVDSTGKLSASVTTNLTLPNAVTNNDTRSITMSNNWSFQNITTTFGGNINAVGGLVTGGSLTAQNIHDNGLSDNTVPYASAGTHTLTSIANGGADTVLIGTAPPSFAPISDVLTNASIFVTNISSFSYTTNITELKYNIEGFGAVGNGKIATNVSMASGSSNITVTGGSFVSGDIGKVISIYGAGSDGQNLTTIITNVSSVNAITVSNVASASVSGNSAVYGTDDTAAIQGAMNFMATNGGGTLIFPVGIYIVNGPLLDLGTNTLHHNAQLYFPEVPKRGNLGPTVMFQGVMPIPWPIGIGSSPTNQFVSYGACIWSTLASGPDVNPGRVIDCRDFGSSPAAGGYDCGNPGITLPLNNFTFATKNLIWRAAFDNNLALLDMQGADGSYVEECVVDTGWHAGDAIPPLTHTNTWGVKTAGSFNENMSSLNQIFIRGFYNGLDLGENATIPNLHIEGCVNAIVNSALSGGTGKWIGHANVQECSNQVVIANCGVNLVIDDLDIYSFQKYTNTLNLVQDPSANWIGKVHYSYRGANTNYDAGTPLPIAGTLHAKVEHMATGGPMQPQQSSTIVSDIQSSLYFKRIYGYGDNFPAIYLGTNASPGFAEIGLFNIYADGANRAFNIGDLSTGNTPFNIDSADDVSVGVSGKTFRLPHASGSGTRILQADPSGFVTATYATNLLSNTNTAYWLTNSSTGITNTGGNVIVNGGTLQIGTKSFLFNDGTFSLDNGIFSAGASSLSLGGTLTATNLGGTGTAFVQSSAAGVLSRTIDGSGLTNVTGTNIINTYKTFPSATNALALNNDYQLLSIGTDCSITNFTGGVANQVRWSTLIVSNSAASGITMRITAAGRAQGLQTTNGISIPAGKTAFISALILGTLNTNYCTTVQQ